VGRQGVVLCKNDREIEKMREAGRIVAHTLKHLAGLVAPGLRTEVLAREAERMIRVKGASPTFKGYEGFPAAVCVSINEQVVHGIPSARKIKEGDIVSIDCGATLDGYIGDAALTVMVGSCRPEVATLVETTRMALFAGIAAAQPGSKLGDISHAVEKVAAAKSYGIVREYCGHGVGKTLHEAPQVPNYGVPGTGIPVRVGWTVAIEPMINLGTHEVEVLSDGWTVVTVDRKPSAHFEHTVAVTTSGPIILTLP
jgi:methionyl aminopeptidase